MEHARKMALVDPRLLDMLRSPPPPATDTVGKKVQALDDDMKTILDRKDLDDGTKVTLTRGHGERVGDGVGAGGGAGVGGCSTSS